MKYLTPFIIAALVCSTAAADPEQTTCDSPCDCHNAHGEGRWSVKSDASLPPTDASHELLKSGDLFDVILIQMKGGSARRPNAIETQRLMAVATRYCAKDIVLFAWKRGESCEFYRLSTRGAWSLSSAREIFG